MLTPVPVRFPEPMLIEIDMERAKRLDAPDRSSMIRQLVAEALTARKQAREGK